MVVHACEWLQSRLQGLRKPTTPNQGALFVKNAYRCQVEGNIQTNKVLHHPILHMARSNVSSLAECWMLRDHAMYSA